MKNIASYSLITMLALVQMTGCSGGNLKLDKPNEKENKEQIDASMSLVDFMDKNPDIAKASLKDIRAAAGEGTNRSSLAVSNMKGHLPVYATPLKNADKAVVLIDDVVAKFSLKSVFDAGIRLIAVATKFPKEAMMLAKAFDADDDAQHGGGKEVEVGPHRAEGKGKGMASKLARAMAVAAAPSEEGPAAYGEGHGQSEDEVVEAEIKKVGMNCQEIMDDPSKFISKVSGDKITDEKVESALKQGKELLTKAVKSCPEINGGAFAQCAKNITTAIVNLNTKLTCSIDNFNEVETIVGQSVAELKKAVGPCVEAFKKCDVNVDNMMDDEDDHEGHKGHGHDRHGHGEGEMGEPGFAYATEEPGAFAVAK